MGPCGLKCLLHQTLTLLLGVTGSRHASVGEVAAAAQLAGLCLHRARHGACSVGVPLHRCELNAIEHFQFCAVISFARRALDFLIQDRADGGGEAKRSPRTWAFTTYQLGGPRATTLLPRVSGHSSRKWASNSPRLRGSMLGWSAGEGSHWSWCVMAPPSPPHLLPPPSGQEREMQ